jgi:hypothetical protein
VHDREAEGGGAAPERGDAAFTLLLLVALLTLIDEGFTRVSVKLTIRANLWAVAVLARGLSIRPDIGL